MVYDNFILYVACWPKIADLYHIVTEIIQIYKYWLQVELFAGALRHYGVEKGDVVLIYLPMIPQAVIAMMASARLGAVHTLVFGGFASKELATRINHAQV